MQYSAILHLLDQIRKAGHILAFTSCLRSSLASHHHALSVLSKSGSLPRSLQHGSRMVHSPGPAAESPLQLFRSIHTRAPLQINYAGLPGGQSWALFLSSPGGRSLTGTQIKASRITVTPFWRCQPRLDSGITVTPVALLTMQTQPAAVTRPGCFVSCPRTPSCSRRWHCCFGCSSPLLIPPLHSSWKTFPSTNPILSPQLTVFNWHLLAFRMKCRPYLGIQGCS